MIADQTIISARAEKSQRVPAQRVLRQILTPCMAAILLLPSLAAWGMDRVPGKPVSADAFEKKIALPPIPHLDSMPWMKWNAGLSAPKIDTLMPPHKPSYWFAPTPRDPSVGS